MSFSETESRHLSYAELDGVMVKIPEKYRFHDTSLMQQVEMACLTLKDLHQLDKYEYSFETEHQVLQNLGTERYRNQSAD